MADSTSNTPRKILAVIVVLLGAVTTGWGSSLIFNPSGAKLLGVAGLIAGAFVIAGGENLFYNRKGISRTMVTLFFIAAILGVLTGLVVVT